MLAAFAFFGLTGFWAYIAYFGTMAGLSYLGGRLLAPSQPEPEAEPEGAQSRIWNPHTIQHEGGARPRSYGKNLHHGNIIAKWTDVADNREVLYLLLDHGDGPTKGVVAPIADNVFLENQPASNFTSVEIQERLGTMSQTCMTGFEKPKLEYKQAVELKYGEPFIFTTPNDFFDDLECTICWPNGIFKRYKDGGWTTGYITLKISISVHDEDDWTTLFNDVVSVKTMEPYFRKFVASTQGFECEHGVQYDLKLENLSPVKEKLIRTMELRSVREVIDTAFTHPGRALVGIRAVATAQLSGNIDVKVIREDRIINTYNGTSWELKYDNNRSNVAWDAATLPVIDGDGIGENPYTIVRYDGIDPQYLDLEFFYKWAQFCAVEIADGYGGTEPRSACNMRIDEFTDIYSLVCKIAAVGRANIYWRGHQLTGWIDDVVTTPIDLVTMDSMMHKTWKNAWVIPDELMGVAEVFYEDEKLGYERTSAEWASEDAGGYRNIVSFEGIGIITSGAAIHYANYLLERNHLIRNKNQFRVHKEGFRYKLGEVVRLQCRIANWGSAFRVVSSTANTITVDRDASAEIGAGDVIHIRSYNTVLQVVVTDTYEVDSVEDRIITATENWDVTPVKGNLAAVGPAGAIKLRRIIKMTPTVDNYFDVEVETYDVVLFDADDLDPQNPNANYIWPGPIADLNTPITRAEIRDMISQQIPPQPDIEVPFVSSVEWTGDEVDTVSWDPPDADNPITVSFRGVTYEIEADETTDEFIYWDPAFATTFQTTNLVTVATAAGRWYVCRNVDGVAYPVNAMVAANIGVILAGYLRVGTADIDDLSVETIKIKDNAVTIPASAYNPAEIGLGASEVEVISLGITTTGLKPYIQFSGVYYSIWGTRATFRIYRDSTKIYEIPVFAQAKVAGLTVYHPISFNITETDAVDAGPHTYTVKGFYVDDGVWIKNRSLYAHELKK